MVAEVVSAESLRDEGNNAVKTGDWNQAIDKYTDALTLTTESDATLKALLHRNRALARLKIDDFEGAEADCTKALSFDGADSKALYRRSLAREQLDEIGGAFSDAKEALRLNPKDKAITEVLQRLVIANSEKIKKITSMDNKVSDMAKLAFEGAAKDFEQKQKAYNNLLVLSRESESGANRVWNEGKIIPILLRSVEDKKETDEIAITAIRIIDELCKNHKRAMKFMTTLNNDERASVRYICRLICLRQSKEFVDAAGLIVQRLFNAMAKMDRTKEMKPDPEVAEENKLWILRVIQELREMLVDKAVSAVCRETVIDLFTKNLMHMDGGIPRGWSWDFVAGRGLLTLLDVSSQIPEQCDYPVSHETRQHIAICLSRLDDDMVFDTKRTIYKEKVDEFYNSLLAIASDTEEGHKIRIKLACFLITMLQGPINVGINLVTNDQITAMMMQMAASEHKLMQSVAAELIVMTVSKHERATAILKVGIPILRKLYDSEDENVRVRALVGLCKCASAGGDDASKATMKEGAPIRLAQSCKKFLLETKKFSVDVRRFACEGLSYLSLDADVKEWIVDDSLLLQALLCLAKSAGALCVYTLATIYVNLTNSYEKPKVDEEMVKLAQFAKHHVPEVHHLDTEEFVEKRTKALVEEGSVAACMAISNTESKAALELIARAISAFSDYDDLRGRVISEGGTKLCLRLCKDATPEGKIKASHALAKLGCKSDPNIVFPGQRSYEVVKPMVDLLHPEVDSKANYDALLTLTNLASMSDSVRKRIIKERAVYKIEEFWFMTEHEYLRAAAAELLLNLLFLEDFFKEVARPGTDKLKLWVLYAAEEDERLARASSAGFAILTEDEEVCTRVLEEIKSWPDIFKEICMHEDPEAQRRGLMGVANIMKSSEKNCSEIVASEIFRILVAVSKLGAKNKEREGSTEQAVICLEAAEKFGLIKPTDREIFERTENLSTISE